MLPVPPLPASFPAAVLAEVYELRLRGCFGWIAALGIFFGAVVLLAFWRRRR